MVIQYITEAWRITHLSHFTYLRDPSRELPVWTHLLIYPIGVIGR
jgi:hypothetical protein